MKQVASGRREVAVIERPPEWVRLVGLAAFDRREPEVRVADLEYDSLMSHTEVPAGTRLLRFATEQEDVSVTVNATGMSVSLAIAIVPARLVRVDVRPIHGPVKHAWTDGHGRVTAGDVPAGPLSILVHWPPPIGPVRTAWIQV